MSEALLDAYTSLESQDYFREALETILNCPLTAETIDSYADTAVESLIGLSAKAVEAFSEYSSNNYTSQKELEDAAFAALNLSSVADNLAFIQDLSLTLLAIDKRLEQADLRSDVIVPTDNAPAIISSGETPYRQAEVLQKTKTLLFVLAQDYDVPIEDSDAVKITKGIITDSMMRSTSYYCVEVPALSRVVLTCDELGNMTYIFDTNTLKAADISSEDIMSLTKNDLNDLLKDEPTLGSVLRYSKNYPARLSGRLQDLYFDQDRSTSYLFAKRKVSSEESSGEYSEVELHHITGIGRTVLAGILVELDIKDKRSYSDTDLVQVQSYAANPENNIFLKPPEGVVTAKAIAEEYGIGKKVVYSAIRFLRDEGVIVSSNKYQYGGEATFGYDTDEVAIITEHLANTGKLTRLLEAGYLSQTGILDTLKNDGFKIHYDTLSRVIKGMSKDLGELREQKSAGRTRVVYSPSQIDLIIEGLRHSKRIGAKYENYQFPHQIDAETN